MCSRRRYLPEEIRYRPREGLAPGEEPVAVVTLTSRVVDGRFWLRPDGHLPALIQGVIGRAQAALGVRIYAVQVSCNHLDLVVGVHSTVQSGKFGDRVFGQIAQVVNLLRGRTGKVFEKRMSLIPTNGDPEDLVRTLRYVLSNTVKEHAIGHALWWPGPHSARRLALGEPMKGWWLSQTAWSRAKKKDPEAPLTDFVTEYEVVHSPLPGMEHLSEADYRRQIRTWLDEDAQNARAARAQSRREAKIKRRSKLAIPEPPPADRVARIPLHTRPLNFVPTPPPFIQARDPEVRQRYREALAAYCEALATNRARLLAQVRGEGTDFRREGVPVTGLPPWDPTRYGSGSPPPTWGSRGSASGPVGVNASG